MNEREAIEFILQEIKEQRREDFNMYFEMRQKTTESYDRFLDRLREIDEKERESSAKHPIAKAIEEFEQRKPSQITQPWTTPLRVNHVHSNHQFETKQLPESKAHGMTPTELKVDRVERKQEVQEEVKEPTKRSDFPSPVETTEFIENYLKEKAPYNYSTGEIQRVVENHYGVEWTNFSNVMERAINMSPFIKVQKVSARKRRFSYKK